MEQQFLNSYSKLSDLNVSRETYLDFESFYIHDTGKK